jgi:excisionase family DNA binding protein
MKGLIELPLEDTIDTHTAARTAQVTASTVRRWCDEGRIAACKPVGRWRIYRSAFLAWIESSNIAPKPRTHQQLTFHFSPHEDAQNARNTRNA